MLALSLSRNVGSNARSPLTNDRRTHDPVIKLPSSLRNSINTWNNKFFYYF